MFDYEAANYAGIRENLINTACTREVRQLLLRANTNLRTSKRRVPCSLRHFRNSNSSASIPLALDRLHDKGGFYVGQRIVNNAIKNERSMV